MRAATHASAALALLLGLAAALRPLAPLPTRSGGTLRILFMSDEEEDRARQGGRPPIIPFDFSDLARDDVVVQREAPPQPAPRDEARPSGFDSRDADEEDEPPQPGPEDAALNPVLRFLKSVYVSSPFDSQRRREAKMVVRNISGFSLAIGVVFTLLWYLSPVKFVSFKGAGGGAAQQTRFDSDELLRGGASSDELLDDELGQPDDNKRFAIPSSEQLPSYRTRSI